MSKKPARKSPRESATRAIEARIAAAVPAPTIKPAPVETWAPYRLDGHPDRRPELLTESYARSLNFHRTSSGYAGRWVPAPDVAPNAADTFVFDTRGRTHKQWLEQFAAGQQRDAIAYADMVDARNARTAAPVVEIAPDGTTTTKTAKTGKANAPARAEKPHWMGLNMCAAIRALAAIGADKATIAGIMPGMGFNPSPSTIHIQSAKAIKGDVPATNAEQSKALAALIPATTAKPAKKKKAK